MLLFLQLPGVVSIDKKPDRSIQGLGTTTETTVLAMQASQIMAQVGIVAFHAVGLALSRRHLMGSGKVNQGLIGF